MPYHGEADSTPAANSTRGEAGIHREIERKFLVERFPDDVVTGEHKQILQGYVAVGPDGREVRIRRLDNRFLQTVKTGRGRERDEIEIELTRAQFDALWPATAGRRIRKTRYEFKHGPYLVELDRFEDGLAGLLIAEVEFETLDACEAFQPPPWFGREVTHDERYKNRNLALEGAP